jgi:Flp pilus assembly protein TadD
MVDLARENDVMILFMVPPSNEKDFSPFKSETASSFTPEESAEWNNLVTRARNALARQDAALAIADLDKLVARDPVHAGVRFLRGRALLALGRGPEAKSEFTAAIDEDVAPLRATSTIRQIIREVASERDVPLLDVQELLETIQTGKLGHTCLGNEFLYDHCHPTIETHQLMAKKLLGLARQEISFFRDLEWRGYDEQSLSDSVLASLGTEYFSLRNLNLAKVLRWAGKKEEAWAFVRKAAQDLPTHPEAQYLLGVYYQERGKFDSASAALRRAVSLDPSNANALSALGSISLRQSRYAESVLLFRKAISLHPALPGVRCNLGNAFAGLGEIDSALQAYRSELSINPDHLMTMNNLGVLLMNKREFSKAIPLFQRVLQLDPSNIEAYSNLGLIAHAGGRTAEARAMFEQVLRISPTDRFAREWLNRVGRTGDSRQ